MSLSLSLTLDPHEGSEGVPANEGNFMLMPPAENAHTKHMASSL